MVNCSFKYRKILEIIRKQEMFFPFEGKRRTMKNYFLKQKNVEELWRKNFFVLEKVIYNKIKQRMSRVSTDK